MIDVRVHKRFAMEKELIKYGYTIIGIDGEWLICLIE